MPKGIPHREEKCDRHQFVLRPLGDIPKNAQYYNASFCSCGQIKKKGKGRRIIKKKPASIPHFNRDRNYATPAFILPEEEDYYQVQGPRLLSDHQRKMEQYTEEKQEINVPKPRTRNNFCSVCKANYDDYLEHILSEPHKKKIQRSYFNTFLLEFHAKFARIEGEEKNVSATYIDDSDQVVIIENPRVGGRSFGQNGSFCAQKVVGNKQLQNNSLGVKLERNFHHNPHQQFFGQNAYEHTNPINTFQPFSSLIHDQANITLNMNFFLNPPHIPMYNQHQMMENPYSLSNFARHQLSTLQNSLINQLLSWNQLQRQVLGYRISQQEVIVIDE